MSDSNVEQAVPFFSVIDMNASLKFYVDGLGFEITKNWTIRGRLRWCWLQLGGAALMLQEYRNLPEGKRGEGVSISFQCKDALAICQAAIARGVTAKTPFVGNNMWVTAMVDPDGYKLKFESPTDVPEGTKYGG